jgi:hypothetical protein
VRDFIHAILRRELVRSPTTVYFAGHSLGMLHWLLLWITCCVVGMLCVVPDNKGAVALNRMRFERVWSLSVSCGLVLFVHPYGLRFVQRSSLCQRLVS